MAQREKLKIPKRFVEKYGENFPIWSFSRINTLENCSYEYYLKYIKKLDDEDNIYTVCGTCAHDIIQGFYDGKIKYNEMVNKFEEDFLDIEISDYKFSSDEEKNTRMRNKYKECVIHFFKHHQPIKTKVLTERPIWVDVDGHVFMGYVDAITKDKEGNYYIIDWKTSSIYKGSKVKQHAKQLLLYALGLHQAGIPLEKIRVTWNFLKYCNITYKQKNGKYKVVNAERNKWVSAIKTPLKRDIKSFYNMEDWEVDLKYEECVKNNSLETLDKSIQEKYKISDCYVYADVSEQDINELKKELIEAIELINQHGADEKNWERDEITSDQEYYCSVLCGQRKNCKYYKAHLEKLGKKEKEEADIIAELDEILPF